jgi:hypothetical protein
MNKEKNIERPYLNDFCEKCIYHYLLDGDEARCSKIHLGTSSVMCVQVVSCDKYTPQKKYTEGEKDNG